MRPIVFASVATFALAPIGASAQMSGPIMVSDAWSRPAVQGTTGAGFMTLMNHGKTPQALVKVESPLARKVEIHRSAMTGGVMTMTAQSKVDIPPAGMVTFAPGGYHLMFMGLAKALKAGDKLPATLTFTGGRKVKVDFAVGAGAPGGAAGAMDHMDHTGH